MAVCSENKIILNVCVPLTCDNQFLINFELIWWQEVSDGHFELLHCPPVSGVKFYPVGVQHRLFWVKIGLRFPTLNRSVSIVSTLSMWNERPLAHSGNPYISVYSFSVILLCKYRMPTFQLHTNVSKDSIPENFLTDMSSTIAGLLGKPEMVSDIRCIWGNWTLILLNTGARMVFYRYSKIRSYSSPSYQGT